MLVQATAVNGRVPFGTNQFTASFVSAVGQGNTLVLAVVLPSLVTCTVADSLGQNWTQAGSWASGDCNVALFYFPGTLPGACTVTITNSAQGGPIAVALAELSGLASLNGTVALTGTSSAPATGTITASSGDVVLAAYGQLSVNLTAASIGGGFSLDASLLNGQSVAGIGLADHTTSGNEGGTFNLSSTVKWSAVGASFTPAPVPAPTQAMPPFTQGPPDPSAPWFVLQPVEGFSQAPQTPATSSAVQMPPFTVGPDPSAPWYPKQTDALVSAVGPPPPIPVYPAMPPFTEGPPDPSAPWFQLQPVEGFNQAPPTPVTSSAQAMPPFTVGPDPSSPFFAPGLFEESPQAPPAPIPPAPTIPGGLPLIARDPKQDPRTRRFTEMVGDLLNSLKSQGYIKQDRSGNWQVVPTRFVADRPPGGNDDETTGVQIGTTWLVRTTEDVYICVSADEGSARWKGPLLAGTPAVDSVFGRTGDVVAKTGDYSVDQVTGAAPIDSPDFTGEPTSEAILLRGDSSKRLATTGFVQDAVTAGGITIGENVLSSIFHGVLFVNGPLTPHNVLAQDTVFLYNPLTQTLTVPALSLTTSALGIGSGGTGLAPALVNNGQLLIGNGAGFTLATLTAGSNVTITNGSGTITIAASGSMAIGGSVTSGTAGSVLFVDGSGNLAQDNGHLFWDSANARLCLGRTSGNAPLTIDGSWLQALYLGGTLSGFVGDAGTWESGTPNGNLALSAFAPVLNLYAGNSSTPSLSLTAGLAHANELVIGVAGGVNYGVLANLSGNLFIASDTGVLYLAVSTDATASVSINDHHLVGIGTGTNTPNAQLEIDTYTATEPGLTIAGVASQTGVMVQIQGTSSTTANRPQADLDTTWVSSTDATRKARFVIRAWDTAAREAFRCEGDGSQALISFYGVSAVARQVLATGAGHTVDDVITALQNLGLVAP